MLAAEDAYAELEAELQDYLDNYEATHDYDEYHFDLDEISHDPYVLISILSALHDGIFTIGEVQGDLSMLFDKQYILTENVVVETRYRTETDTWTDAEGNTHTDTYQVPYDYYICYVTLENFDLSHVPVYIMDEETLSFYSLYMSTLGNRPDLFSGSQYDNSRKMDADYVQLDELLKNSDIVTLHVPLCADTRHLIGQKQIGEMKQGAFLINTGRGALVDTGALVEALESGKLGGAALDVLEGEDQFVYTDCSQKVLDHPFLSQLLRMPNVIITPHTAYYTERVLQDTTEKTIRNCLNFERSLQHE